MEIVETVKSGEHAFRKVHEQSQYEYLARHTEDEDHFASAMSVLSMLDVQAVLAVYNFSNIGTLVDVGGGQGTFLAGLLRAHPSMRGIVFDHPAVAERARQLLRTEGLADRAAKQWKETF
jgi:hypothetical protein